MFHQKIGVVWGEILEATGPQSPDHNHRIDNQNHLATVTLTPEKSGSQKEVTAYLGSRPGSVFTLVGHLMSGGLIMADVTALISALIGVGMVMAKDGGR